MDVNPAAVILLVVGFIAVVAGIKGTQGAVGSLLTGRGAGSSSALGPVPTGTQQAPGFGTAQTVPKYSVPAPTGVHGVPARTPLPSRGPLGLVNGSGDIANGAN